MHDDVRTHSTGIATGVFLDTTFVWFDIRHWIHCDQTIASRNRYIYAVCMGSSRSTCESNWIQGKTYKKESQLMMVTNTVIKHNDVRTRIWSIAITGESECKKEQQLCTIRTSNIIHTDTHTHMCLLTSVCRNAKTHKTAVRHTKLSLIHILSSL